MSELNVVKRLREIKRRMEGLSKKEAVIGVIDNSVREDGLTNVDLLAIHEFGSVNQGIPERPVMRSTSSESAGDVKSLLSKKIAECLRGDLSVDGVYSHMGIFMKNKIIDTFDKNDFTPIKSQTAKRKGSSKALIDTGALRASINYEVRNRE